MIWPYISVQISSFQPATPNRLVLQAFDADNTFLENYTLHDHKHGFALKDIRHTLAYVDCLIRAMPSIRSLSDIHHTPGIDTVWVDSADLSLSQNGQIGIVT